MSFKKKIEEMNNHSITEKYNSLMDELPEEKEKKDTKFWKAIIKDTNDIYSLSTAMYVFIVIVPIIIVEIKRSEPRFTYLVFFGYNLGEIPMALNVVLVSVILTTLVNYFRILLSSLMSYVKGKLNQ